jgi:hypothetical protein
MASSKLSEPSAEYFRARAAEAREMAEQTRSLVARQSWADIAKHWEEMAERAKASEPPRH